MCSSLLISQTKKKSFRALLMSSPVPVFVCLLIIIQFVCRSLTLVFICRASWRNPSSDHVRGVVCQVAETKNTNNMKPENQASYVVETITMTTVTEHRIIQTAEDANAEQPPPKPPKAVILQPPALPEGRSIYASSQSVENMKNDLNATVIPKFNVNGTAQAITGILKGGKLRKTDPIQVRFLFNFLMGKEVDRIKKGIELNW